MGIRQLASQLNLSIGTVSRALNDRPDVSPETRARVKAAAAAAGYVPDQSGRSLRSGRTGIVAAVIPTGGLVPSADSGLFVILEGVRRTLGPWALDLIILFRGPEETPLANLQRIVQRRIADAVLISQTAAVDPRLEWLETIDVKFVSFGRSAVPGAYPVVDFDFEPMARETVGIFVRDGHRHLGVAISEEAVNYENVILQAFREEAEHHGLCPHGVQALPTRSGRLTPAARQCFEDRRTAPTAILASHERIAAGLYADLAGFGLTVGRDVAVICTFPTIDTGLLAPPLSHFDADLDAVGVALGERLLALLVPAAQKDVPDPLAPTLVPLVFVPRASHGHAADEVTA